MSAFNISNKDWNKLQNYSRYAWDEHQAEIGGFLVVQRRKDGTFIMHDPVILEQEITASNTTITKQALAKYFIKTAMKYGTDDLHYCWWHSHHTMDAFWSGTDLTAIKQGKNNDWSCSLVVNLKGEYLFRINQWEPIELFKDIEIGIEGIKEKKVPKAIVKEVEELCSKPVVSILNSLKKTSWKSVHDTRNYNINNLDELQTKLFNDSFEKVSIIEGELLDAEIVQLEASFDNILTDYINDDDFMLYKLKVKSINSRLCDDESELRLGIITEKSILDSIINHADANDYIYRLGQPYKWDEQTLVRDYSFMLGGSL